GAVAAGAARLAGVLAPPPGRVAPPPDGVPVERRPGDGRVRAPAAPVLAGLARGAGVVVVARGAVRLVRVRAHARGRVARPRHVTLVEGRAGDGRGRTAAAHALARLARAAGIGVVARGAVRLVRVCADPCRRVSRASHVALIEGCAGARRGALPVCPVLAGLARGAGVVVVARGAVRLVRVRAHAGRRVTRARDVALIEGRAGDGRGRAPAAAVLAGLARGAGVVVVARAAVRLVGVGAHARGRVARPGDAALVEGRADDGRGG